MTDVVLHTELQGWPVRRGKVRDVYDVGEALLLVATDRISAFDWVLPTGIPDKGRILTALSRFWFPRLQVPHHLISADVESFDGLNATQKAQLAGRAMLVKKAKVIPFECVVRGYLSGSGWQDYRRSGAVCGVTLPPGLCESQKLPVPVFTPATKAQSGHDENVSFDVMAGALGNELAGELRTKSIAIYQRAAEYAAERGILLADTKFEWGIWHDQTILIDEVLTPDSSRYWPADSYAVGGSPPSFDKQFVRNWLESTCWDKQSPPPDIPPDIVAKTRERYLEALRRLTGRGLDSKA